MANDLLVKRSAVQGKVPGTSDLQLGELAINTFDGNLYLKKDDGSQVVVQINPPQDVSTTANVTFNSVDANFIDCGTIA